MTDRDALLAAVLAAPDDDLPRLVYADFLDEHGDPDRAAFIRSQVHLAALPPGTVPSDRRLLELRAAEQSLLTRFRKVWLAPLRLPGEPLQSPATHGVFRRGFVERVWMPAAWFVRRAGILFRRTPARELRVTRGSPDELAALLAHPDLPRLDTLDLGGRGPGDALAALVATSPLVGGLGVLRMAACGLTDDGAESLAGAEFDWRPRELDVTRNPVGPAGVGALRRRYGAAVLAPPA